MYINPILATDSYKQSHWEQYPPGTEQVVSYIEARGFTEPFAQRPEVVLMGVNYYKHLLNNTRITHDMIREAKAIVTAHGFNFNEEGWKIIANDWKGHLPVGLQALPEGTVAHPGIPLVQIRNLDERLPWLTSFLETGLLRAIWYPSTVATVSREAKKTIKRWMTKNCDTLDGLPFKLHDFGARGVSSQESAVLGGVSHLVNFMGTDTLEAIVGVQQIYDTSDVVGYSVPAAEHSTITSWGRENEVEAYRNMLDKFGGGTIVSVVSDSYDIFAACKDLWGGQLKDKVLSMNATLVVRPDSGDPVKVTLELLDILGMKFGFSINSKGYRVLNNKVRIIQGDGINLNSIDDILRNFDAHGWSADNIVFGMGGALLQQINRDTLKFAMKANEVQINGVVHDVYKDPVTDSGKRSKRGAQAVVNEGGVLTAVREDELGERENHLQWVWAPERVGEDVFTHNVNTDTFEEVRNRAAV